MIHKTTRTVEAVTIDNVEPEDTRFWIWKELFLVRIPYIQMRTADDLEAYGMPVSGHTPFDRQTPNELRDIMIPIVKMIDYYQKGASVYIVNQGDTKRIYEYIANHLQAWKYKLQTSMYIGNAPLDDLRLMDEFARSIYEHAKYLFTDEFVGSITGNLPKPLQKLSRMSLMFSENKPAPVQSISDGLPSNVRIVGDLGNQIPSVPVEPEKIYPEHEGIGKFLDDKVNNPGLTSLNNRTPTPPSSSRASLLDNGGLSYQSLVQRSRSWRS